jgi:endonuclease-3
MEPGTYTLLVELPEPATVEFGAKGAYDLDEGWYAYTGSAFGAGGLKRVERHRRLARGESDARHWHVDYLLGHPAASVETVYVTENEDVECETARALNDAGTPLAGLGASDCDCPAHLAYSPEREALGSQIAQVHEGKLRENRG